MGKGTDLWDDSALINAFDHAMTTYKEMHSNSNHSNSAKEEKDTSDKDENDLVLTEKIGGHGEPWSHSNNISSDTTKIFVPYDDNKPAPEDLSSQGNTSAVDVHHLESDPHLSGLPCTDAKLHSYTDQQSVEYDQLVKEYYELEEQKQKVVQRLHQANYWNYQTPVQSSTCQLPQVSGCSTSEHGLQTPCSLCSCHYIAVPLIPSSTCAIGGLSSGCYSYYPSQAACCSGSQAHNVLGSHFPANDGLCSTATMSAMDQVNNLKAVDSAAKAGMLAVERAIDSTKMEMSESYNDGVEKRRKDISSDTCDGKGLQGISSQTDLTAVLNAWYLAGFHTGRYLSVQSKKNANQ